MMQRDQKLEIVQKMQKLDPYVNANHSGACAFFLGILPRTVIKSSSMSMRRKKAKASIRDTPDLGMILKKVSWVDLDRHEERNLKRRIDGST